MYRWNAFPFIRITLFLIGGILLFDRFPLIWIHFDLRWACLAVLVAAFNTRFIRWPLLKGFIYLLLIVYAGGCLAVLADPVRSPEHYTHYSGARGFSGVVVSDETERTDYYRYEVNLRTIQLDSVILPARGKIYLYLRKQDAIHRPNYGDVIVSRKGYFEVAGPKNPDEFDYRQYLKRQGIYAHAFVASDELQAMAHSAPNLLVARAYAIRAYCKQQIADYIPEARERAILTALLLGIKDYLDEEVETAYASAGAMHVLAVSGLHVGIVYLIIGFLFRRWKNTRGGKIAFVVVATATIWIYALITGFSPSVMRAVTMFTVIIISDGWGRRSNIFNSLGIAAFVLILYDPHIFYSVGFQLSFAAVFGIVILHPMIYRKWHCSATIPDYLWSITCVSIAAQIATFPLTLLYFHQFPTYFLISNLVVIPAATVMLVVGIAMLLLGSIFAFCGEMIGVIFQPFVWLVNESVDALRFLPYPLFDWLYFDVPDVVLVYLILGLGILTVTRYRFQYVVLLSVFALTLSGWQSLKAYRQREQHRMVFYKMEGITAIDLIKGNEALLLIDELDSGQWEVITYQVNPHRLANGLPKVAESWQSFDHTELVVRSPFFDFLEWDGVKVLMPKNSGNYDLEGPLTGDFILFKDPDLVGLNQMICDQVILGNDFNRHEVTSASKDLASQGLSVHSLSRDGYMEINLALNSNSMWATARAMNTE